MKSTSAAVIVAVCSSTVQAAEPSGCEKFAWPINRDLAALRSASLPKVEAGEDRTVSPQAFTVTLAPALSAGLPKPPERAPKQPNASAGFVRFKPPSAGLCQVALSAGAWVDVIQADAYLKPAGFSGASDCVGLKWTPEVGPAVVVF